ncbi:hypothetical protein OF83DRAFT_773401 [Amylostereum chailletii]|nr:hypothetical protein OF83DRAFT_773401 [Amylostereum chailletii]
MDKSPIHVISKWYQENPADDFFPSLNIAVDYRDLQLRLNARGITAVAQSNGSLMFPVTRENARFWASILSEILKEIVDRLTKARQASQKNQPPFRDRRDLIHTVNAIDILKELVDGPLLDILIRRDLSQHLEELHQEAKRSWGAKLGIDVVNNPSVNQQTAKGAEEADPEELDEDFVEVDEAEEKELPKSHVIRHLKNVTSWSTAVHSLCNGRRVDLPIIPYLVTFPTTNITFTSEHIEAFKTGFLQQIPKTNPYRANAKSFVDSLKFSASTMSHTPIHAESGLMGLASATFAPAHDPGSLMSLHFQAEVIRALTETFKDQEAPIGVSKKCCWCWRRVKNKQAPSLRTSGYTCYHLSLG